MTPVNVTVTGAAGQIGYALLFRIASGQLLGPDSRSQLRLLEIPQAVKAAEGTAMELDDCAFPLLRRHRHLRRPERRLRRRQRRAARRRAPAHEGHGARRPARGQRRRSSSRRARRSTPAPPTTCGCSSSATRPTPTRSSRCSNAPDVPRERFTAMTRLDHNRAVAQLAEEARRRRRATSTTSTIWGNHSPTHVPRPVQREGERRARGRAWSTRTWYESEFIPTRRQARRGDHRGARRVVGGVGRQRRHRPRPRLGPRHARRRLGLDGASPPTAPTASTEGLISRFPVPLLGRRLRDRAGPRDRRVRPRAGSTPPSTELDEERDAVRELGLV